MSCIAELMGIYMNQAKALALGATIIQGIYEITLLLGIREP